MGRFEGGNVMGTNLRNWKNQLNDLEKNIAKILSPHIEELFTNSVTKSLAEYYRHKEGAFYNNTYNFLNAVKSVNVVGTGNIITMTVSSEYMNDYPSFCGNGRKLYKETAFDFFFKSGEHGHGEWALYPPTFPTPYEIVNSDIMSGFNGRINKVFNSLYKKNI